MGMRRGIDSEAIIFACEQLASLHRALLEIERVLSIASDWERYDEDAKRGFPNGSRQPEPFPEMAIRLGSIEFDLSLLSEVARTSTIRELKEKSEDQVLATEKHVRTLLGAE